MNEQSDHELPPQETSTNMGTPATGVEDASTFSPAGPPRDSSAYPARCTSALARPTRPGALASAVTRDTVHGPLTRNGMRNRQPRHIDGVLPGSKPLARFTWNRTRVMRLFVLLGAIGSALSVLVITIDGLLRPGYSAISGYISDMGDRPRGWLLNKDLIVTGLLIMLFAIGLHGTMGNAVGRKSVNLVTGLFLLAGAGIANDGVFTEYKALELHLLGFYTAFGALTLVFFVVGLRLVRLRDDRRQRWHRFGWYSLITGLVELLFTLVYLTLPINATDYAGLIERLIVGAAFAWQFVTAVELLQLRRMTGAVSGATHAGGRAS